MKKNSLLLLASVAVLLTSVGAAQDRNESEAIALPTYVVTAPRVTLAEQQVQHSLATLRSQASAEAIVASELPMIKTPAVSQATLAKAAKDAAKSRVAKN